MIWNKMEEPISTRLRNDKELNFVVDNNPLMYNPRTGRTALVVDVFIVDPHEGLPEEKYDGGEEDRYVNYVTNDEYKKDWSVDLDDEGWIWLEQQGVTND